MAMKTTEITERLVGTEEAIARGILELLGTKDPTKVKMLSDLSDDEIGTLSLLTVIGDKLRIPEVKGFVEKFCQFRVSRFRLGRREMVNIASYTGLELGSERRRIRSLRELIPSIRG